MSIEALLTAHLEDDLEVAGLVGDRIFAGRRPAGAIHPLIVYRRITTRRTMSHDGPGLAGPLFEFSCWAESETQARQLRRAVARALDVVTTADFRSFVENELELQFAEAALPRAVVDARVWYDPDLEEVS